MPSHLASPAILFLHIGWAREYRDGRTDPVQGQFGYVVENGGNVGETVNFRPFGGRCYGYASSGSLDLTRLGAAKSDAHVDHVLVVFTATNPDESGRYIVGWYKDARVYRAQQNNRPDRRHPDYIAEAGAADAQLVPVDDRVFFIPSGKRWPGRHSAFYAADYLSDRQLDTLKRYVDGATLTGFDEVALGSSQPQLDIDAKLEVERVAIRTVQAQYETKGFRVYSVEKENVGWDLETSAGRRRFLIEVKGRSGMGAVELTPNEYRAMRDEQYRMRYRLAIVHDALSPAPRLALFSYLPGRRGWFSDEGHKLAISPQRSAIVGFDW